MMQEVVIRKYFLSMFLSLDDFMAYTFFSLVISCYENPKNHHPFSARYLMREDITKRQTRKTSSEMQNSRESEQIPCSFGHTMPACGRKCTLAYLEDNLFYFPMLDNVFCTPSDKHRWYFSRKSKISL